MRQESNGTLLVSRRAFLYGTAGASAALALGMGLTGCDTVIPGGNEITYLEVPETSLLTLNDFEALDGPESKIQQVGQFEIPYGTLVWADDEDIAACLLPTDSGSPLARIGLLHLGSGTLDTVVNKATSIDGHFEIYDVRATAAGLIWTEANILEGTWRVYTARLADGAIEGEPVLAEEGTDVYDTPMLAVTATRAFWQVVPKSPSESGLSSRLMSTAYGNANSTCVYECSRRMGTPPYSAAESVTITPRVDSSTLYYQLTNINAITGDVVDTLTLPSGMSPLEAGYGNNGFMFSFANIYNYGDGISNLGTYTPMSKPSGSYGDEMWFGFARTPSAAPAWCNDLLIVKSSYSVCGVDLKERTYFAIDVDNGAENYGEYLASSGMRKSFVTYSNIDHQPVGEPAVHACRVKTWTTLS